MIDQWNPKVAEVAADMHRRGMRYWYAGSHDCPTLVVDSVEVQPGSKHTVWKCTACSRRFGVTEVLS